jgi:hypothetical protein
LKIFIFEPEKYFDKQLVRHIDLKACFQNLEHEAYFSKELCDVVQNPESADFIIFPYDLTRPIMDLGLFGLLGLFDVCNIFHKYYWKFIFIYKEDLSWKIPMGGTWLRTSFDKRILSDESIAISLFSRTKKFVSIANCKMKANFVGSVNTHPIRGELISYLSEENFWSKIFLLMRGEFHGPIIDGTERIKREMQFYNAMERSYMTLCPRGTAMTSNRFFETMSLGRVPILIAEHCALPFQEEINYEDFCFNLNYDRFNELNRILDTGDKELRKMCKSSYKIYSEYLSMESYSVKLVCFLKKNKEKIYEHRKNDGIFHCQLEMECLSDYCYSYFTKYYEAQELINTVQLAIEINKMTKDPKKIERINTIILDCREIMNLCASDTVMKYMNGLLKYMKKDFGIKHNKYNMNSLDDFHTLTDIYAEKLLM